MILPERILEEIDGGDESDQAPDLRNYISSRSEGSSSPSESEQNIKGQKMRKLNDDK